MTTGAQISQMIQRNAVVCPDRRASIHAGRDRTWGAFAERVERIAGGLQARGVQPGDRVAMLALNSDRYLEFFFAVSWAGALFVPINIRLAPPEVIHWLSDSGSSVLIVDDTFLPMAQGVADALPELKEIIHAGDKDAPPGMARFDDLAASPAVTMSPRGGDDLAGLFYTGGTTGLSKGVMLSHGNLMNNAMVAALSLDWGGAELVYLHAAPMFHLADGSATFGVTLTGGAHAYVPAFTPAGTLARIAEDRATAVTLVPVMLNMMINAPEVGDFDLSSLKLIAYGASPMPQAVLRCAMDLMPGCRFAQGYGQTECAPLLTVLPPECHDPDGPLAEKMASVGQPVFTMDVRILDENDNEVPRGTVGEICARGPSIMQGYRNRPEQTAETWRNGWHHTGDGGYMDEDGYIFVVDRLKDMIISGGENVYSAEVENALYQHPGVAECAVIGIPSDKWGEEVHAIVRARDGQDLDTADLIAHCHGLIAGYKCPRGISLVTDPLPLSGAGKILKAELRKPWWEGHDKQVN
jgi:long-chain acyl-CoA synthetase